MKTNLDSIIHRTQRYWYIDGLAEMTAGLFLVALSGYFLLQARIKTVSFNPILANIGLLAVVVLVLWLFSQGLQAVKARLTYPRTGYVAPPRLQKSSSWQRYGIKAWLAVACISLLVMTLHWRTVPSWAPLLMGAVAGITVLALSYRFRLLRFTFLACALVLVGAVISFLNPGTTLAEALSATADGVCFIISGGVTLVRYLHSTRPPAEAGL